MSHMAAMDTIMHAQQHLLLNVRDLDDITAWWALSDCFYAVLADYRKEASGL